MNKRLSYWEKLRDPRWQEKRLQIMKRAGFACERCDDKTTTLNVHHTYYERGHDPWEYPDESLQCLCEPCHKDAEEIRSKLNRQIAKLARYQMDELLGYAMALEMLLNEDVSHVGENHEVLSGMVQYAISCPRQVNRGVSFLIEHISEYGKELNIHDIMCAATQAEQFTDIAKGNLVLADVGTPGDFQ